jgi:hypothetical protein
MKKEYTWDITSFDALEKALKEGVNVFKWNVVIAHQGLCSLSTLAKFSYSVEWFFDCWYNKLTTLEGCPDSVWWSFDCQGNKLTTLEWWPKVVGNVFDCSYNYITSLVWCPQSVEWDFHIVDNELKTLEWYPEYVKGIFACCHNKFISLEHKKWKIFQLWKNIYIWSPSQSDIQKLIECDTGTIEKSIVYYKSFVNFNKSTIKLDKKDITDTDISFNGKKFKRKYLGL